MVRQWMGGDKGAVAVVQLIASGARASGGWMANASLSVPLVHASSIYGRE